MHALLNIPSDAATVGAIVAAAGATLVALITSLVSLLGLIISKEQKVSEFRQAWIDALRQDTATLLAHANTLCASLMVHSLNAETWVTLREHVFAVNELSAKIKLRLNRKEKEHEAVQKTLEQHDGEFALGDVIPNAAKVVEIEKKLVAETQIVLKQAWNTVRDGERTYKIAKTLTITAIASCCLALAGIGIFALWKRVRS